MSTRLCRAAIKFQRGREIFRRKSRLPSISDRRKQSSSRIRSRGRKVGIPNFVESQRTKGIRE